MMKMRQLLGNLARGVLVMGPLIGAAPLVMADVNLPAIQYRGSGFPPCASFVTLDDSHFDGEIVIKTSNHGETLVSTAGYFMRLNNGVYDDDLSSPGDLVWVAAELRDGTTDIDFNRVPEYRRQFQLDVFQQIVFSADVDYRDYIDNLRAVLAVPSEDADVGLVSVVQETSLIHRHGNHYDQQRCVIRSVNKLDSVAFPEHDHRHP